MGALSKRAVGAALIDQHIALFACPLCQQSMHVYEQGRLVCSANHSFDIAKQGYVNMLTHGSTSKYSKDLFESRKAVIDSGIYDVVEAKIGELIYSANTVLDTGCGEGSHLARIMNEKKNGVGIGIDIAKEGILAAARHYPQQIWCVGDLAKSPFAQGSFDAILNILSPANYEEFKRLLAPNGCMVKVVPQSGYLQELRAQLYADSSKETYSNEQIVARFQDSFGEVNIERVTYTLPLAQELVPALLEMTPMGWHKKDETDIVLSEITIDVDLLVGKM
ncbi:MULTISPECIES: putative RNA methyltransferase [Lysinibacillus]|uniref:23S rRNA m(1)G-748 methyltransferase n=1 Tax=Lysinibacillus fusiformis TaxID=28031 RepID=A0A1H9EXD4_9BACI|nr:methyltransferase domain-containing protein [Lysinibacillus fusiformis]HAU35777.1 methyltransferase domain-containing protein [Lysinibacillus sp.]NOG29521.1 methyltransferase domain-containing protein [Lysinibacillus fusiformis]SCY24934.1 23S rRNA m(1)G-748 methyltransferase [Lysinibacillus fusiformis]SEN38801.1 23S rRNA m(1)G-748 methyltransferase [Lysinibacillus fusiformis]SEQ30370.1 23S rRNA m(1)G-748 methyltransferase [Lysinibacillus fusiformis]